MEEVGLVNMNPLKKPERFINSLHTIRCNVNLLDCSEMTKDEIFVAIQKSHIKNWIFTGSPSSVHDPKSPVVSLKLLDLHNKRMFLICYSMESILHQLGYPVVKRNINKKEEFVLVNPNIHLLKNPARLYRNHQYYTPRVDNDIFIANYENESMIAIYKNSIMTQFHPERSDDGLQMLFNWIFA